MLLVQEEEPRHRGKAPSVGSKARARPPPLPQEALLPTWHAKQNGPDYHHNNESPESAFSSVQKEGKSRSRFAKREKNKKHPGNICSYRPDSQGSGGPYSAPSQPLRKAPFNNKNVQAQDQPLPMCPHPSVSANLIPLA